MNSITLLLLRILTLEQTLVQAVNMTVESPSCPVRVLGFDSSLLLTPLPCEAQDLNPHSSAERTCGVKDLTFTWRCHGLCRHLENKAVGERPLFCCFSVSQMNILK